MFLFSLSCQLPAVYHPRPATSRGAKAGEERGVGNEATECTVVSWIGSWNRARTLVKYEPSLEFS